MPLFSVEILYRTQSGCNGKLFPNCSAESSDAAYRQCVDKVRRMRGVVKIDGGNVVELKANRTLGSLCPNIISGMWR